MPSPHTTILILSAAPLPACTISLTAVGSNYQPYSSCLALSETPLLPRTISLAPDSHYLPCHRFTLSALPSPRLISLNSAVASHYQYPPPHLISPTTASPYQSRILSLALSALTPPSHPLIILVTAA